MSNIIETDEKYITLNEFGEWYVATVNRDLLVVEENALLTLVKTLQKLARAGFNAIEFPENGNDWEFSALKTAVNMSVLKNEKPPEPQIVPATEYQAEVLQLIDGDTKYRNLSEGARMKLCKKFWETDAYKHSDIETIDRTFLALNPPMLVDNNGNHHMNGQFKDIFEDTLKMYMAEKQAIATNSQNIP